jgi:ABC-type antimicrobial peptide transport system permease subunit
VQIGIGALVGVAGAVVWDRISNSAATSDRLRDPIDRVLVVALVAATAMTACLVSILRALRLDPIVALRSQ